MNRPGTPNVKYVATLAVVASLILLGGALLRPRARSAEQPPPSETDLARLARLTERRSLESATAFLNQLADDVAPSLVWLERAGTGGVVWTADTVVTARFAAGGAAPAVVTTAGGDASAARVDWSPDLPVASVAVAALTGARLSLRSEPPTVPGAPVIAVWKSAQGRLFASGAFVERAAAPCGALPSREVRTTLVFTHAMAGGGLFDLDGSLLGAILPCGDRYAAIAPDVVDGMLLTLASFESRLVARYGLMVEALTNEESAFFKITEGAMVRELRVGRPAAMAGLRTGDIVVGLNGAPVTRTDDLRSLAAPVELSSVVFSVRRESSVLEVSVGGGQTAPVSIEAGASGIVWESPQRGFRVETVLPGSRAAAAGVQSGDRVIRVGPREPESLDQVRRALEARARTAIFVEIERDGRRRGALVTRDAR